MLLVATMFAMTTTLLYKQPQLVYLEVKANDERV